MFPVTKPKFSGYEVERTIKASDQGCVCVVRNTENQIRCIYREFEGDAAVYRKLKDVNSPRLPQVYMVAEQDGRVFVVEEYVAGDTLAFLLEAGPLPQSQVKKISVQLCDALTILHNLGMVHRDIKPENVILRGSDAVLIDFDASRLVKPESTTDTRLMGTSGYAAPEQYGFFQTDARADIYSLGILINELLTRQHPSKTLADGPLRPIIERCIEVNVDKRYPSAAVLRADILTRNVLRQRKLRRLLGLAAAVLCCAAVFFALRPQKETEKVFERQPVGVSSQLWEGSPHGYTTAFEYDLDGDGKSEHYQFGIFQQDIPAGFQWATHDSFVLFPGQQSQRRAYPAVWQYNDNGQLQLVEAFAPLLEDTQVTLHPLTEGAPLPEAYTAQDLWTGGIQVLFTHENQGEWLYSLQATLDGQQLTAAAVSIVKDEL